MFANITPFFISQDEVVMKLSVEEFWAVKNAVDRYNVSLERCRNYKRDTSKTKRDPKPQKLQVSINFPVNGPPSEPTQHVATPPAVAPLVGMNESLLFKRTPSPIAQVPSPIAQTTPLFSAATLPQVPVAPLTQQTARPVVATPPRAQLPARTPTINRMLQNNQPHRNPFTKA